MSGNTALQELFDGCGAARLVAEGSTYSATALHHGSNDWARAFRRAGIARGDRIICALPNGAAFVQLLVAALADGVTLAPVAERTDVVPLLELLDARLAITSESTHPHVAVPSKTGGPPSAPLVPRPTRTRSDHMAFLLRTSGTSGAARWIALSETNVLAVLQSHLPQMALDGASVLCILPWFHAFGLILGLLPALLRARLIVAEPDAVRNTSALIAIASQHATSHLSMVPLTASRLAATDDGLALLRSLQSGLVGGAPIDAQLAAVLSTTKLRVGYGQTEASPGIMLSYPGEFRENLLGRPVGCEVRVDDDGVLAFRGPNACAGFWEDGALTALMEDRWQRTGDIVTVSGGVYTIVGRASLSFKLQNGRIVNAPLIEHALRLRCVRVTDVVVVPTTDHRVDLIYSTYDGQDAAPGDIEHALGGVQSYLRAVVRVPLDAWTRTPKGDIDRTKLPVAP